MSIPTALSVLCSVPGNSSAHQLCIYNMCDIILPHLMASQVLDDLQKRI